MATPMIVGFYSDAARSGKTTAAEYLVREHEFRRIPIAGTLKAMAGVLFQSMAASPDQAARWMEEDKDTPQVLLGGRTPRSVMISLGTDWGRTMMTPNLWINAAVVKAARFLKEGHSVTFDDIRFPNEYTAVMNLAEATGAIPLLIHVVNTDLEPDRSATEGLLRDWAFHRTVRAAQGAVDQLEEHVAEAIITARKSRV